MYSPFIPVHINCTPEIKNVIQIIVNKPSDGLVKVIDFTTIIINNTNAVKRNNKPITIEITNGTVENATIP